MSDLVIDVQILQHASGHATEKEASPARMLLRVFKNASGELLVVDTENLILSQYRRKLGTGALGLRFVQRLLERDRVERVPRARINRGDRVALQDAGFNCGGEDYNYYVRTTAATVDRRLVTKDQDYNAKVCQCLKRKLDISVADAEDACRWFQEAAE